MSSFFFFNLIRYSILGLKKIILKVIQSLSKIISLTRIEFKTPNYIYKKILTIFITIFWTNYSYSIFSFLLIMDLVQHYLRKKIIKVT